MFSKEEHERIHDEKLWKEGVEHIHLGLNRRGGFEGDETGVIAKLPEDCIRIEDRLSELGFF